MEITKYKIEVSLWKITISLVSGNMINMLAKTEIVKSQNYEEIFHITYDTHFAIPQVCIL